MLIFSGPHDEGVTSRDRLLGLTVVVLWGLNFLAIRVGLDHFPPFFFVALRFAVIAIPVLIFIPRPAVRTRWLLLYGTGFGILQFAFLFTAMRTGMPTGLASLVLQSSAPIARKPVPGPSTAIDSASIGKTGTTDIHRVRCSGL